MLKTVKIPFAVMLIAMNERLITGVSLPRYNQQISTNNLQNQVQQTQLHRPKAAPTAATKVCPAWYHSASAQDPILCTLPIISSPSSSLPLSYLDKIFCYMMLKYHLREQR